MIIQLQCALLKLYQVMIVISEIIYDSHKSISLSTLLVMLQLAVDTKFWLVLEFDVSHFIWMLVSRLVGASAETTKEIPRNYLETVLFGN